MHNHHPPEAGKSSYDLCDLDALWSLLPLAGALRVLDAGCGAGLYTLDLASRLDSGAGIVGVDAWEVGIERLLRAAEEQQLDNVEGRRADLSDLAFLPGVSVDLVFMATVLHDLVARGSQEAVLSEIARVLRPGGCFAVIEFHKRDSRPGPPVAIRLAPDRLEEILSPFGFIKGEVHSLGEHLYAMLMTR